MYTDLIDYFNKGIKTTSAADAVSFKKVNELAVRLGYVIHPDCCNKFVVEWLKSKTFNYNATFYKEWNDVLSKSRFELFIDQLMHYATTYGTDFSLGNGYVPNDGAVVPAFTNLKVLEPIAEDELYGKCINILKSGIALKESTTRPLVSFVEFFMKKNGFDETAVVDVLTDVKNKEAQAMLAMKMEMLPNDEFGILRCIVYRITGSCLLIKSRDAIHTIKYFSSDEKHPIALLTDAQIAKLSRIFYRFKPLFLAMKNKRTARTINKIRRLAKKNHTPFHVGFWENIVSEPRDITEVCCRLKELDNFKKIRLLMILKERLDFPTTAGIFPIRNGKIFVRENYEPSYDKEWLGLLFDAIRASLVNSLKSKACSVRLPSNYRIALPSSEKTFVGNIPFGSSFQMSKNNVVGVYWRNEWGTRDFDLSMVDITGSVLSWRCDYVNGDCSVIYSGDMTNAAPEASELFFIKNTAPDGIIKLNKFNGDDKSQFRFFFGNENRKPKHVRDRMIDPNNIKIDVMVPFDGQGEKTIGMVFDNCFYFMDFASGKSRVSSGGKYVSTVTENMSRKARCFIYLDEILHLAGFNIIPDDSEVDADMDFTTLEKDSLVNLLSSEE